MNQNRLGGRNRSGRARRGRPRSWQCGPATARRDDDCAQALIAGYPSSSCSLVPANTEPDLGFVPTTDREYNPARKREQPNERPRHEGKPLATLCGSTTRSRHAGVMRWISTADDCARRSASAASKAIGAASTSSTWLRVRDVPTHLAAALVEAKKREQTRNPTSIHGRGSAASDAKSARYRRRIATAMAMSSGPTKRPIKPNASTPPKSAAKVSSVGIDSPPTRRGLST